jgi:hypothetical protein
MVILIKSITDLKTPQPYHGKNLARLARECFANRQALTLDFEGIETITRGFFQELLLPLVAEFGADFLKGNLQIANVNPDVEEIMTSGLNNPDDDFDQRTLIQNREGDVELYKLNLAWLIKARELARENPMLAELMMGINSEEMRSALGQLSIQDIQYIAQSGWLCFSPRFTSKLIQNVTARQHEVVDLLLGLSGSL